MIRPLRPEAATAWAAAYFVTVLNVAFWRQFLSTVAPNTAYEFLFVGAMFVVAFCLLMLFFGLFAVRRAFKPLITTFFLLGAAVAYFINEYGVLIDAGMVRNVFQTNTIEAAELITLKLLSYVLVLGGLPSLLLLAFPIAYRPFWLELWFRTKATLALLAIVTVVAFPFAQNIMSVFREHRALLQVFTPLNYLSGLAEYARQQLKSRTTVILPFGEDAHRGRASYERPMRSLTI